MTRQRAKAAKIKVNNINRMDSGAGPFFFSEAS